MASDSPMMKRVRRGSRFSALRIPRKGRIRIIMAVVALVLGFRIAPAIFTREKPSQSATAAVAAADLSKEESSKPAKIEKKREEKRKPKPPLAHFSKSELRSFGSEQLRDLLRQSTSPRLKSPTDTILSGNQTIILHHALDTALQNFGEKLMQRYRPLYGAAVVMEPRTGRILALISYKNDSVPDLGSDLYCRSIFPAASVYKTITAAAAIEVAHLNSQSPLKHVGRNHTLYKFQLQNELRQFNEIPLEEAYAHSINPVFARIGMYMVGSRKMLEYSSKFGFNEPVPFELDNDVSRIVQPDSEFSLAELASGFNQHTTISPLFGAMLASAISERGAMPRPILVDSVKVLPADTCIFRARHSVWRKPIREETARELRFMMTKVSRYGTARKSFRYMRQTARFDSLEYGGKTGSVDKDSVGRVDWFVGFARHPSDARQQVAVGIVTVHGAYWTVHSSFLAAELLRTRLRLAQLDPQKNQKPLAVSTDSSRVQERQKQGG